METKAYILYSRAKIFALTTNILLLRVGRSALKVTTNFSLKILVSFFVIMKKILRLLLRVKKIVRFFVKRTAEVHSPKKQEKFKQKKR